MCVCVSKLHKIKTLGMGPGFRVPDELDPIFYYELHRVGPLCGDMGTGGGDRDWQLCCQRDETRAHEMALGTCMV